MMRMVIAGGSGFVGRDLQARAEAKGWQVTILGRTAGPGIERWDPVAAARRDAAAVGNLATVLDGADFVLNLAGYAVADGRLGKAHKAKVLGSRTESTRAVAHAIAATKKKPRVWLNASAIGYYGDSGEDVCGEGHAPGNIFLSEVCTAWEREVVADTRTVIARIGIVLSKHSEPWQQMAMPIRMGVGGPLGNGRQWMSWISLDDLSQGIFFLLENDQASGPFNLTAPEPVRQKDLVRQAAKALRRPAFVPAPAFALKIILGAEMADNIVLASCNAVPEKLLALGYHFAHSRFSDLVPALL
jgi:uncharacterized protein (TIGR01777 family)